MYMPGRATPKQPVVSRVDAASAPSSRLRAADRDYLALVSDAAFANPFGARRRQLDAGLVESSPVANVEDPHWTPRMRERLNARLRGLLAAGPAALARLPEHDRVLVENAVCFETFHRFIGELRDYIEAQESAGERPLRVSFAGELLRHLSAHGIASERALRIFELFYQMGRAHYFISRGLVGQSAAMSSLRERLWETIFTRDILCYEQYLWNRMEDFSTILVGETGTGKGAAASAIGRSGFIPFDEKKSAFSHGFALSFVPINLNEFADTLFESEIFGHRKGAFTGAGDDYRGVLARCPEYGTVFFDEIGEATLPIQVKLLRVLQERLYTPVGSREPSRFGGRIVAATHRSLDELRERGALRDDFYYRLCSNVVELPPLRVRIAQEKSELPALIEHLCARIAGADTRSLAREVSEKIERDLGPRYGYPGNVRELEQCVRRVLLTGGCAPDLARPLDAERQLAAQLTRGELSAEALLARYCGLLHQRSSSYVEVARITGLDRRTVKRHVAALRADPRRANAVRNQL